MSQEKVEFRKIEKASMHGIWDMYRNTLVPQGTCNYHKGALAKKHLYHVPMLYGCKSILNNCELLALSDNSFINQCPYAAPAYIALSFVKHGPFPHSVINEPAMLLFVS